MQSLEAEFSNKSRISPSIHVSLKAVVQPLETEKTNDRYGRETTSRHDISKRESSNAIRLVTGALAGTGLAALVFPLAVSRFPQRTAEEEDQIQPALTGCWRAAKGATCPLRRSPDSPCRLRCLR
jgi:hypothetical protein